MDLSVVTCRQRKERRLWLQQVAPRRSDRAVRENFQVVVISIHTTAPLSGDLAQHAEAFQQVNRLAGR